MFKKTLFLNILLSSILSSDIEETNLDIYASSINSFFNNDSTGNNIFEIFDKNYIRFKDIDISIPVITESSPVEITLTNNNNERKVLVINPIKEFREKLFMVLCINSFLSGSFEFGFNEKEIAAAYDNSHLKRKLNMLTHFNDNYKSLQYGKTELITIDNGHFFINKYESEIILLCLNYFDSKQQYNLNLSKYETDIGLSLLDRSMIRITDGIAQINLSKYQTKIFNLKR